MNSSGDYDPIAAALAEDIGRGDVTCAFFIPRDKRGLGRIMARQEGVVAGVETAAAVFARVDQALGCIITRPSGETVSAGVTVLEITGSVRSILTAERVALNFLQRLSGVATLTRQFADAVEGTGVRILDTRKTTPGLRAMEKQAVAAGGGVNHRFGLFDMAMLKDNHLAVCGTGNLQRQIALLRETLPDIRIELEADTVEQVAEFVNLEGIDVILLDNMSLDDLRRSVALRREGLQFEASGGVSLETVGDIARTGVDFVSVGALTHSAPAVDFSLELEHAAE